VILDNLNHHKNRELRQWCADNNVELAFTPHFRLVARKAGFPAELSTTKA